MAFQPIVDTLTKRVFAYEALVRGADAEPAASVFANVTTDALHAFDQVCREKALNTAVQLGFVGLDAALAMNFLPNAIYDPHACFQPTLQMAARHGLDPARIIFEISENEAVANPDHLALIVEANRSMGWRTALDDFGARHSNLELLVRFRPDLIKLDMVLIRNINTDTTRQIVLRHCVDLCRDLGIPVIAEGIETIGEYKTVRELGVTLLQGFLFGKPGFLTLPQPIWPEI